VPVSSKPLDSWSVTKKNKSKMDVVELLSFEVRNFYRIYRNHQCQDTNVISRHWLPPRVARFPPTKYVEIFVHRFIHANLSWSPTPTVYCTYIIIRRGPKNVLFYFVCNFGKNQPILISFSLFDLEWIEQSQSKAKQCQWIIITIHTSNQISCHSLPRRH